MLRYRPGQKQRQSRAAVNWLERYFFPLFQGFIVTAHASFEYHRVGSSSINKPDTDSVDRYTLQELISVRGEKDVVNVHVQEGSIGNSLESEIKGKDVNSRKPLENVVGEYYGHFSETNLSTCKNNVCTNDVSESEGVLDPPVYVHELSPSEPYTVQSGYCVGGRGSTQVEGDKSRESLSHSTSQRFTSKPDKNLSDCEPPSLPSSGLFQRTDPYPKGRNLTNVPTTVRIGGVINKDGDKNENKNKKLTIGEAPFNLSKSGDNSMVKVWCSAGTPMTGSFSVGGTVGTSHPEGKAVQVEPLSK